MYFWILIALVATSTLGAILHSILRKDSTVIQIQLWVAMVVTFVSFLVIGTLPPTSAALIEGDRIPLRALGAATADGSYLMAGTDDGQKTVNFFTQTADGKASSIGSRDVGDTLIFDDTEDAPYMVIQRVDQTNYGAVPWPWLVEKRYDFHVPKDSVDRNLAVE